jgi:hypothetical protein
MWKSFVLELHGEWSEFAAGHNRAPAEAYSLFPWDVATRDNKP